MTCDDLDDAEADAVEEAARAAYRLHEPLIPKTASWAVLRSQRFKDRYKTTHTICVRHLRLLTAVGVIDAATDPESVERMLRDALCEAAGPRDSLRGFWPFKRELPPEELEKDKRCLRAADTAIRSYVRREQKAQVRYCPMPDTWRQDGDVEDWTDSQPASPEPLVGEDRAWAADFLATVYGDAAAACAGYSRSELGFGRYAWDQLRASLRKRLRDFLDSRGIVDPHPYRKPFIAREDRRHYKRRCPQSPFGRMARYEVYKAIDRGGIKADDDKAVAEAIRVALKKLIPGPTPFKGSAGISEII